VRKGRHYTRDEDREHLEAIDRAREAGDLNWKELGAELGVSPNRLRRLDGERKRGGQVVRLAPPIDAPAELEGAAPINPETCTEVELLLSQARLIEGMAFDPNIGDTARVAAVKARVAAWLDWRKAVETEAKKHGKSAEQVIAEARQIASALPPAAAVAMVGEFRRRGIA
jgi:hypothetical protein